MLSASGGLRPPDPLIRGSAPGPRWGLCPQTPIIGSCSALAMVLPNHWPLPPPMSPTELCPGTLNRKSAPMNGCVLAQYSSAINGKPYRATDSGRTVRRWLGLAESRQCRHSRAEGRYYESVQPRSSDHSSTRHTAAWCLHTDTVTDRHSSIHYPHPHTVQTYRHTDRHLT